MLELICREAGSQHQTMLKKTLLIGLLFLNLSKLVAQEKTDAALSIIENKISTLIQDQQYTEAAKLYDSTRIADYSDRLNGQFLTVCKELGLANLGTSICKSELMRNPRSYYWQLKKVQFLSYQNQLSEAETILKSIQPADRLYYEVALIVYKASENWLAYRHAAEQLVLSYKELAAAKEVLFAFNKLNALHGARDWINTYRKNLQQIDATVLGIIEARLWLIWSNQAALNENERYAFAQKALVIIDSVFATKKIQQQDSIYLLFDKMNALYAMNAFKQVADLYKSCTYTTPAYIDLLAASAALENRQAADAIKLFEKVMRRGAMETNGYIQYTYALSDLHQYEKAVELLDSLISREPNFVTRHGKQTAIINYDKIYLTLQKVKLRYYGGYHLQALRQLDTLMQQLPMDLGLYQVKGNILEARGRLHAADDAYTIAAWNNLHDAGLYYNMLGNYMAQFKYAKADSVVHKLSEFFPYSTSTKRATKEWKEFHLQSLEITGGYSNTYGLIQNGQGYTWGLNYSGKPIQHHWKTLLSVQQNFAEIPEGTIRLTKYRAGIQFRKNNFQLNTLALFNNFGKNEIGFSIEGSYFLNNQHTISATIQRLSEQQPLRGLFYGITANQYGAAYVFRPHESFRMGFQYDRFHFTDNNRRNVFSSSVEAKLYHHSAFQLTGIGQVYSSNNRSNKVTYFSPLNDLSAEAAIRLDHTISRKYEFAYQHSLQLSGTYYQQNGFKGGWIGGLSYKQELALSYTKSIWIKLNQGNRLFDGIREPYFYVDIGLYAKF